MLSGDPGQCPCGGINLGDDMTIEVEVKRPVRSQCHCTNHTQIGLDSGPTLATLIVRRQGTRTSVGADYPRRGVDSADSQTFARQVHSSAPIHHHRARSSQRRSDGWSAITRKTLDSCAGKSLDGARVHVDPANAVVVQVGKEDVSFRIRCHSNRQRNPGLRSQPAIAGVTHIFVAGQCGDVARGGIDAADPVEIGDVEIAASVAVNGVEREKTRFGR